MIFHIFSDTIHHVVACESLTLQKAGAGTSLPVLCVHWQDIIARQAKDLFHVLKLLSPFLLSSFFPPTPFYIFLISCPDQLGSLFDCWLLLFLSQTGWSFPGILNVASVVCKLVNGALKAKPFSSLMVSSARKIICLAGSRHVNKMLLMRETQNKHNLVTKNAETKRKAEWGGVIAWGRFIAGEEFHFWSLLITNKINECCPLKDTGTLCYVNCEGFKIKVPSPFYFTDAALKLLWFGKRN